MKSPLRSALYGFTAGVFFALAPSCGPTPATCDATTCPSGCCNASGACTTSSTSTCGIGGASCQECTGGKVCSNGTCTTNSAGGGAGGGSAGGAGGGSAGGAGGGTAGGAGGGTAGGAGGGTAGGAGGGTAGGAGGGTAGGAGGGTAGGAGGGTAGGAGGGTAGGAGGGTAGGAGGGTAGGAGGGTAGGAGGGTAGGAGGGSAGGAGGGSAGGAGGGSAGGAGGGSAGGAGGGTSADGGYADYFCTPLLDALCGYLTRCGSTATSAGCTQLYTRYDILQSCGYQEVPAVKDGRLAFDGGAALRCLDAYKNTFSCNNIQAESEANADCQGAQLGLVANNGNCFFDGECNAGAYCTAQNTACPGTCQPRKAAGATASVMYHARECQQGLVLYDGTKCTVPPVAGGSCAPISPSTTPQACPSTHYCSTTNVCTARKATGAACTSPSECLLPNTCSNGFCAPHGGIGATCNGSPSLPCFDDLFCNSPTSYSGLGVCAAPSATGGPCWFDSHCQLNLFCSGVTFPSTRGTCAALKTLGQTCTQSSGAQCASGLFCSAASGTCQSLKTVGQTCSSSGVNECGAHLTCTTQCVPDACYDPTP